MDQELLKVYKDIVEEVIDIKKYFFSVKRDNFINNQMRAIHNLHAKSKYLRYYRNNEKEFRKQMNKMEYVLNRLLAASQVDEDIKLKVKKSKKSLDSLRVMFELVKEGEI